MSDIEFIKAERFRGLRMLASFTSPEKEVYVLKDDVRDTYHVYTFTPGEYGWAVDADAMNASAERAIAVLTGRLKPW